VRVAVPSIGVDAPVVAVGVVVETGAMEVPSDVDEVGWYSPGPAPGAGEGSAVLSGHVDSRSQGPGAFFPLEQVEPGAEVAVTLADGSTRAYRVEARRRYPKQELPVNDLFAVTGAPRLILVTCGGAFDTVDRQYSDNVVVYALPV
jgi:sortase (surface protein transpeptidase)